MYSLIVALALSVGSALLGVPTLESGTVDVVPSSRLPVVWIGNVLGFDQLAELELGSLRVVLESVSV